MAEVSTTGPIPYNTHIDNFYGVLCLFCFLFGTVGNVSALFYFIRKKKDVPTIIYTAVVIVDMLLSILVFPAGVSYFDKRNKDFFQSGIFCDIWGFTWTTLSRMSVFLVALLSVSRAYSLTFPFKIVKKKAVLGVMVGAFLVHILGSSIPLWFGDNHVYHPAVAACIMFTQINMPEAAVLATTIFDYVGIFIPIPIIILSFIQTVLQLAKKTFAGAGRGDASKKDITVTIALFTGTYLFFNVPAAIVILLYNYTQILASFHKYFYLIALYFMLVIPLNAACNPIIYFWRMERMRQESLMTLRRSLGGRFLMYAPNNVDPLTTHSYIAGTRNSGERSDGGTVRSAL